MRYWDSGKARARKQKAYTPSKRSVSSGGSMRQYPFLRKFYQHQAVISTGIQKFLFFLVIATLLYAFGFGEAGVIRIVSLKMEKSRLEKNVVLASSNISNLQKQINRLKDDPFVMEKLGRERYGYVYPNDQVYKIIRPKSSH